ncbi:hypothetical protein N7490_011131 [Penicillium lividum]|nr:hypothetical protein N7490_011131 [Penicillium lividum]
MSISNLHRPVREPYTELGMVRNIAMGARPEYFRKSMVRVVAESVVNMVKHVGTGLVTKGVPRA